MSVSALTVLELERQDTHTDEVGSVDSLVALSDDSVHTLEVGALGSPITGGAGAIFVTSQDNELFASISVVLGSIEDGHLGVGGHVHGGRTNLVDHLVNETDVGKSTTGHDLIITSAGTVGVEVLGGDTTLSKVASGRGVLGDLTSG